MQIFFSVLLLASCLLSPSVSFREFPFSTTTNSSAAKNSSSAGSPAAASFAEKLSVDGLPNLGKVSDQLFRGAQPNLSNLAGLKNLGVTTIVDLRSESSRTREQERVRAEALGMRFVSIPVGGFSNPSSAQVAQFFALLRQTPRETVFVHCRFGHDRTGVFIATYRIAFDHWTAEQALAEMDAFGFNHTWHPSMIGYVRDFANRLHSDAIFKSLFAN
jgi:protein tyrosine/serine phosphatase